MMMKRNKETGLLLPNHLADELTRQQAARKFKVAKNLYYGVDCKHCGYHESFGSKEEAKLHKKIHKQAGCQWMIANDPQTGARRMIRKQLYLKKKEEMRKELNGRS